jgi:phosphatidyl-myo-inositol alpha-mannosyltransferase
MFRGPATPMVPPMRLAVFSYGLPVPGRKRGGIERAAHTLAEGLARRGHRVVVFSHDPAPPGASYEVRELPWKRFVETWLGRRVTMGYLGNLLALTPDYREFDAVIAHGDSLLLPLKGKPIVRIMHGSALREARSSRSPGRFVLQVGVYLQELATALVEKGTVAVSESARRDNGFVRRVIPHGVDPAIFFPEPSGKTAEPSVLFVGALDGRKRGRLLLDLFQRFVRVAHPNASLAMVGPAGPPAAGVTYHTGVGDAELARLYRRAWVYASPSTYEGFGLPYLEAMASGTAVLATPNPGSREMLLDGRCGRLAADAAFAGALVALLGDGRERRALEAAGLQRAREFPLDTMIDRYEALLMELGAADARRAASA